MNNMKLNVGCGSYHKDGWINMDFYSNKDPDIRHNMEIIPWPFENNTFDEILASHSLEHVSNPFEVMKEIHRITKTNGKITIKVPHFSRGFTHADHKRGFDVSFPLYFSDSNSQYFLAQN